MIYGRPTSLWLALVAAILSFTQVLIVNLVPGIDPVVVTTILASFGGLLTVLITLIANQPPTVKEGSTVKVTQPNGDPPVISVPVYTTPTVTEGDEVRVITPVGFPDRMIQT